MGATKDKRIASATFMTSLVDFTRAGELEVFIDDEQVASLERKMNERGYLEGSEMANTFNMLRSNDLIWSFVINNYLLGRDPFPFDLLHWNCDSTRMPAKMHSFYLRNMYMNNLLRVAGGITLAGVPIDLSKIAIPTYFVSAIEDHIAPWKTTYAGPQLVSGKSRFVLSGSGHIAGMINPPAAKKYGFWTNDKLPESPMPGSRPRSSTKGRGGRTGAPGSIRTRAGEVPARIPGKGKLKVIEAAPGAYARIRADET
jgi:polyhydroxyalkanoate synthase